MSTQTDVAKARIALHRAEREERAAKKDFEVAQSIYVGFREAMYRAGNMLCRALENNGQCGICEKPKAECRGHTLSADARNGAEVICDGCEGFGCGKCNFNGTLLVAERSRDAMIYRGPIVDYRPNMAREFAIAGFKVLALFFAFCAIASIVSPERWHEMTTW